MRETARYLLGLFWLDKHVIISVIWLAIANSKPIKCHENQPGHYPVAQPIY